MYSSQRGNGSDKMAPLDCFLTTTRRFVLKSSSLSVYSLSFLGRHRLLRKHWRDATSTARRIRKARIKMVSREEEENNRNCVSWNEFEAWVDGRKETAAVGGSTDGVNRVEEKNRNCMSWSDFSGWIDSEEEPAVAASGKQVGSDNGDVQIQGGTTTRQATQIDRNVDNNTMTRKGTRKMTYSPPAECILCLDGENERTKRRRESGQRKRIIVPADCLVCLDGDMNKKNNALRPRSVSSSSSQKEVKVENKWHISPLLPGSDAIGTFLSNPMIEVVLCLLVLLNCLLVAISTIPQLPEWAMSSESWMSDIVAVTFAVEFFSRWYCTGQLDIRYLARPLSLVDVFVVVLPLFLSKVAIPLSDGVMKTIGSGGGLEDGSFMISNIIPSWLLSNSALVNLRLLRILRVQRVLRDMETFSTFQAALGVKKSVVREYQLQLARVLLSVFTLLSVSTGLIYTAEHKVNPQINDYFTALYFGLTTLTTVGFGDITPMTFQGRLVVSLSILAGVAIIPAQATSLVEAFLEDQNERRVGASTTKKKENGVQGTSKSESTSMVITCPNCSNAEHRKDASFCWACGTKLAK